MESIHPLLLAKLSQSLDDTLLNLSAQNDLEGVFDSKIASTWDQCDGINNNQGYVAGHTSRDELKNLTFESEGKTYSIEEVSGMSDVKRKDFLQALRNVAVRSQFGRNEMTVLDDKVRKSLEVKANVFQYKSRPEQLDCPLDNKKRTKIDGITLDTRIDIVDRLIGLWRGYQLKLHKLIIYDVGGHFDEHVDSQHCGGHIGSLLINLPFADYEGGQLVVKRAGKEVQIKHPSSFWEYQSVAFFNDVPHKVLPVTKGTRVTLQFDIVLDPGLNNDLKWIMNCDQSCLEYDTLTNMQDLIKLQQQGSVPDCINIDKVQKLVTLISNDLLANNQPIALLLKFRYANFELVPEFLKGADEILFKFLKAQGYHVDLRTCLVTFSGYEYEIGDNLSFTFIQSPFQEEELRLQRAPEQDVQDSLSEKDALKEPKIMVSSNPALELLKEQEYIQFTGNESQPMEKSYLGAVMVIHPMATQN